LWIFTELAEKDKTHRKSLNLQKRSKSLKNKERVPAPRPTRIYKLRMMSML